VTLGNNNGTDGRQTDGQTDRQTDRRTDRVQRNMRPPPREEGRIIICHYIVVRHSIFTHIAADFRTEHYTIYIISNILLKRFRCLIVLNLFGSLF